VLFYRAALPLSSQTLIYVQGRQLLREPRLQPEQVTGL
jgi:hypothetical protein